MRIITDIEQYPPQVSPLVLALGTFDGVHRGHQELLRRVKEEARRLKAKPAVFTFKTHPLVTLAPQHTPLQITPIHRKIEIFEELGIEVLILTRFNREVADLSPRAFIESYLIKRLSSRKILVGFDFAFGRDRQGNTQLLKDEGKRWGFEVEVIGPVTYGGQVVSSSLIRELLQKGEVPQAESYLGRPYDVDGQVIKGSGVGREVGIATANLSLNQDLVVGDGVYVGEVLWGANLLPAMINVGICPTFPGKSRGLEVHILDFNQDIYRQKMRVFFYQRLRDEQVFASLEELRRQIEKDIEAGRKILSQRKKRTAAMVS